MDSSGRAEAASPGKIEPNGSGGGDVQSGTIRLFSFMTTLAILEDDPAYRFLLEELVRQSGRYRLVGGFERAEMALPALIRRPVDVVIVDVALPGRSGIEAIGRLRERCPSTRCIVVTGVDQPDTLFAALQAGASGYLLKTESPAQILAALDELVAGGAPLSRAVARRVVASFVRERGGAGEERISEREAQIMDALARGATYKEIGTRLGISAATVKNHLSRIYGKLGVRSRTEAVVIWLGRPRAAS